MNDFEAVKGLDFILRSDELEQLEGLSAKDLGEIVGALVTTFVTGESQESRFKGKAGKKALLWNLYKGLDTTMLKRRKCAISGREGGKQRASKAAKRYQANGQAPLENATNLEVRSKKLGVVDDDVFTELQVIRGGEIASEPDGFAHFMAECVKRFNAATGKNYLAAPVPARQGMLEAFRAGRTLDDVDRVMADVARWEPRYQTLDAVFADGKFEKHVNRDGGERRDWSQYNYLMS